jgi:hypothetical protein
VLDARGVTETVLVVDEEAVLDLAVQHLTALSYRMVTS